MASRSGEMRELLLEAIEMVKDGGIEPQQGVAIAKLAAQVTLSLQVELNAKRDALLPPRHTIGALSLGDETTITTQN